MKKISIIVGLSVLILGSFTNAIPHASAATEGYSVGFNYSDTAFSTDTYTKSKNVYGNGHYVGSLDLIFLDSWWGNSLGAYTSYRSSNDCGVSTYVKSGVSPNGVSYTFSGEDFNHTSGNVGLDISLSNSDSGYGSGLCYTRPQN